MFASALRAWVLFSLLLPSLLAPAQTPQLKPAGAGAPVQRRKGGEVAAAVVPAGKRVGQAQTAYTNGYDLLRRNRTEQALALFQLALQLFKQTGNPKSEAATYDALGDLYARAGQDRAALEAYEQARRIFRDREEEINAGLLSAKIGNLYIVMNKLAAAGTAYEQDETDTEAETKKNAAAPAGLHYPRLAVMTVTTDEQRAFEMVNAERQKKGLKPLIWDGQLTLMARVHAENMARANFLGHVDQYGRDLKGRAAAIGLARVEGIGENIGYSEGYADPVAFAVEQWVKDAEHSAILNSESFTHAGLGMAQRADGLTLFTQVFVLPVAAEVPYWGGQMGLFLAFIRTNGLTQADLYRAFIRYAVNEFGLGRGAYAEGRLTDAERHFRHVLVASDANTPIGAYAQPRRFRAAALTSLADVALAQDDLPNAQRLYTEAVIGALADQRADLAWAAQRGLGRTYWTQSARETDAQRAATLREQSLTAYRQAIATVETLLLGSARADESRQNFLANTQVVFSEAAGALAETALLATPGAPLAGASLAYAAEAFQVVEQGRARALLDLLGEARADLTEALPAEPLRQKALVQARQQEIEQIISGVNLNGVLTLPVVAALEAENDNLEQQYGVLENQLRQSSPRYAALTRPPPLTVGQVRQSIIGEETALLEYSLGEEHSYLWTVTANDLHLARLPARAALEEKAVELRASLVPARFNRNLLAADETPAQSTRGLALGSAPAAAAPAAPAAAPPSPPANDVGRYAATARSLYETLIGPAAPQIPGKRLLIVADGALNYIPFEALVTGSEGESYDALSYLIRSNEVLYAPSASAAVALRQRARENAGPMHPLLILADPVFDQSDPRARRGGAGAKQVSGFVRGLKLLSSMEDVSGPLPEGVKLARLQGTRVEAEQIAGLAQTSGSTAQTMLDLSASETNLGKADLQRYSILHLATHGLLNTERPQFTGLALSLVGDEANDGFLLVDEIFNLRLGGAPLVMLSACETGLGRLKRGDGVSGLTRAFMYAGASTVGVSLWPISDAATAELMPGFYKRMLAKESPSLSAAMRAAQLEMIAGKRYSNPFFWAPFVLVGDGQSPHPN